MATSPPPPPASSVDSGSRKKLTLTSCTMDKSGNVNAGSSSFEVMINPGQYTHTRGISYSDESHMGGLGNAQVFDTIKPEQISFDEIVIDGTGAVAPTTAGKARPSVKAQIDQLLAIVYNYSGEQHEPPWVRLLWGTLIFFGRMESMTTNYTLFKPSGEPLRAKINMSFVGAMSSQEESLRANRSSPDLSHHVLVVEGDTLPLLCYRIYRDPSYYLDIAAFNRLTDFRRLQPGMQLLFPPLR